MPITITDAGESSPRSTNWPPDDSTDPIMMDKLNDIARKARQDAHDAAKVARGGLQSHSWVGAPLFNNSKRYRRNNSTGVVELVDL